MNEINGNCRMWDWERSVRMAHFSNQQPKAARITSMEFINGHDDALLLIGADDGSCRIWRDFVRPGMRATSTSCSLEDNALPGAQLVSAWNCIAEMTPSTRCSGLVLDWDQQSSQILASGDVRIVRVWDIEHELKVTDIPTGSENCVTSIHHNPRGRRRFHFFLINQRKLLLFSLLGNWQLFSQSLQLISRAIFSQHFAF